MNKKIYESRLVAAVTRRAATYSSFKLKVRLPHTECKGSIQRQHTQYVSNKDKRQYNFSGSNTDGSFTMAVSNSFVSSLEKSNSCRSRIIWSDFFFMLKMVYCVYSIESPHRADSNE